MNKFLAGILTFLLWLMPWWTGLYNAREKLTFDMTAVCNKVIRSVENHDVATLESMMRPWIKNNVVNLTGKIEALLDCIDGEITRSGINSSEGTSNNNGIYRVGKSVYFYTAKDLYNIRVEYDVTNSKNKSDVGISWLKLVVAKPDGTGSVLLAEIKTLD